MVGKGRKKRVHRKEKLWDSHGKQARFKFSVSRATFRAQAGHQRVLILLKVKISVNDELQIQEKTKRSHYVLWTPICFQVEGLFTFIAPVIFSKVVPFSHVRPRTEEVSAVKYNENKSKKTYTHLVTKSVGSTSREQRGAPRFKTSTMLQIS